ncbi:hypothetical protein Mp_4g11640 [Marchantia polymorpha subsp. ruderalis]|uniref:Ion transport domain-containing protein n=2 Tax=Marchantia polymorpha TaxID=3197 RepID=A0AAF6B8W2_MARPO|nr:hypothetical protein MARPO_0011s0149 [Marchantia polymorpha]BBN08446.1 hypothetical protein Mp_4g11640 [Marchantia polymorpha subsp. ruderalis]|eukprot:PTQ46481.1 hypothetical protein MARPO_0011s0149 [Marchantia polymorpha]
MPLAISSSTTGSHDSIIGIDTLDADVYRLSQVSRNLRKSRSRSRTKKGRLNKFVRDVGKAGRDMMRGHQDVHTDTELSDASSSSCRLCKRPDMTSASCSHQHDSLSRKASIDSASSQNFLADTTHKCRPGWTEESGRWIFGRVIDPRTRQVQMWNRVFLITCLVAAAIDPLFLYVLSVHMELACIYANKNFAITVTIIRAFIDIMYLCHMYIQLKLAYVSKESLVLGTGLLVWDARQIARNYVCNTWAFMFDVFVILPIPQFLFWLVVPAIITSGVRVSVLLGVVLAVFLFQYIPRVIHMVVLIKRMQHVTGYVFGTAWWGFALNLIAYFVAAHIAGAIWYLLTVNEMEQCAMERCWSMENCHTKYFGCPKALSYGDQPLLEDLKRASFASDEYLQRDCLRNGGRYNFGIYHHAVPLPGQAKWLDKFLYPLFWGLMTLSSFGNALVPGNERLELSFSIFVITCGLLLFMLLIGNIQVFLHSITARKEMMQLRIRDIEWWMRRRQLPSRLRQRVRHYERQRWAATRGVDETSMVADLPEGLRRDIKRHLCLDLVRQVPLFEHMDELVLDNVCERLTAHLFIKGEMVSETVPHV